MWVCFVIALAATVAIALPMIARVCRSVPANILTAVPSALPAESASFATVPPTKRITLFPESRLQVRERK